MEDRQDPMLPFAETVLSVTKQASKLDARATFGRVAVEPNGTNAIASKVTAWLDARAAMDDDLTALVEGVAGMEGVEVSNESLSPGVEFDPGLRDRVAHILGSPPLVSTAAGHDAGVLATAGVPVAMLFVRNATGVSHSPFENATSEDCAAGVDALARLLAVL
jgi:N-carbamoyl-L-amino-acid hydrolase